MPILEAIGEFVVEIFLESIFYSFPIKIYEWITGKNTGILGYRTEAKKFIKFEVAKKFYLSWETDVANLKGKLKEGLEESDAKQGVDEFQFTRVGEKTVIRPPTSISFYSFHFLVQWLTDRKIKTVGIVETSRTAYTTYSDPNSEYLIGQTSKGKSFFITLMEDYSKRQFLRLNRSIETIKEFSVERIREGLKQGKTVPVS